MCESGIRFNNLPSSSTLLFSASAAFLALSWAVVRVLTYLSTICPVDSVCWDCSVVSCGFFCEFVQEYKKTTFIRIAKYKKLFLSCLICEKQDGLCPSCFYLDDLTGREGVLTKLFLAIYSYGILSTLGFLKLST